MTFTLRFSNIQQPDPASQRLQAIATVAKGADLAVFNEVGKDHDAIRALLGFNDYTLGQNAIAWRGDKFLLVDKGAKLVMRGGRLGALLRRARDRRRRGPNRYVLWVVLEERSTAREVLVATHHAISRADTSAKWRRPLRRAGFRSAGRELVRALRRNPSVSGLLLVGDMNTIGRVSFPGPQEVEVRTPATHGPRRYDRLFRSGGVRVSSVGTFTTHSDHKGLSATVTLTDSPEPPPKSPRRRPRRRHRQRRNR